MAYYEVCFFFYFKMTFPHHWKDCVSFMKKKMRSRKWNTWIYILMLSSTQCIVCVKRLNSYLINCRFDKPVRVYANNKPLRYHNDRVKGTFQGQNHTNWGLNESEDSTSWWVSCLYNTLSIYQQNKNINGKKRKKLSCPVIMMYIRYMYVKIMGI
jgi:hypothetical protein